ncbi:glutathione S-transferas-like protein [Decorospora gaudefroyi]|uniref:Glutathione S-transferas-like protein n=1 Tax=Decorospora gaudefroyi TaxID=184978 RepID=A0A6A5KM06_9PLEO|nr:glutathione S-transferas-like protein [Decorospora gaudefroyi]
MADPTSAIQFFDIASGPPVRPYAPNPWKSRFALNAKSVAYQTQWIELPDVRSTRLAHAVAPVRKFPDNTDFYTLPMIYDPNTHTYVGDSLDIAVWLDEQYSDSGIRLFPEHSIGVHRAFNTHVDALFTRHVVLCFAGMPFNPATAEASKMEFCRRSGLKSYEDFIITGEARKRMLDAFEKEMEEFGKLYVFGERGPFLEGDKVSYADFVVGGWLKFLQVTLAEWDMVCGWQGGRWGRLIEALGRWADVK